MPRCRAFGAQIVQARLVYLVPQAMRSWNQDPDFVQLTVRTTSHQVPLTGSAEEGSQRRSGPPATAPVSPGLGEWHAAVSPKGQVYFWVQDPATGEVATTWRRPQQFGAVGVAPADPVTAGASRRVLEDEADEEGRPVVEVVNYCVMERAFRGPADGAAAVWRLCHL